MENFLDYRLSEKEKCELIEKLTPELPLLRTKAGISQEDIANVVGTSRQTYGAIERKTRKMSWNTYLALIWFYDSNRKTHSMLRDMDAFPHKLIKKFNDGDEPRDFELDLLLNKDDKGIIESLDEQALSTIRTVLMLEYSRCNNRSGDAVIKFFEGVDFFRKEISEKQIETSRSIKNIKRKFIK